MGHDVRFFAAEAPPEASGLETFQFSSWSRAYSLIREANRPGKDAATRDRAVVAYHGYRKVTFGKLVDALTRFRPDVVHFHNIASVISSTGVRHIAQRWPVAWTLHDRVTFDAFHNEWQTWGRTNHSWEAAIANSPSYFARDSLGQSADPVDFITPSHWLQDLLQQSPLSQHPSHVLPNIVSTSPAAKEITREALTRGLAAKKIVLAVIPNTDYSLKGYDLLKEAFLRARAALAVKAPGREADIAMLVTTAKNLRYQACGIFSLPDLADRCGVETADYLDQSHMRDLYRSCDALATASRVENLPNVALEAIRDGCPLIATYVGGVPEIFGCRKLGYLACAESSHSLCDGILKVCIDSDRDDYQAALAERWQSTFDSEAVKPRLMEIYRLAIARRQSADADQVPLAGLITVRQGAAKGATGGR
jgi:glycosyltransferase involved in cell wall biosynthesis